MVRRAKLMHSTGFGGHASQAVEILNCEWPDRLSDAAVASGEVVQQQLEC
jgi:hypothetical protein